MLIDRVQFAMSRGKPLWTGLVAGLFLAVLSVRAGLALYHRNRWAYWAVLLVSVLVLLGSIIHAVAEIQRFVDHRSERYFGFVIMLGYILVACGVVRSLLRRESRQYIRAPVEPLGDASMEDAPESDG